MLGSSGLELLLAKFQQFLGEFNAEKYILRDRYIVVILVLSHLSGKMFSCLHT